jgi:hypothetical protein
MVDRPPARRRPGTGEADPLGPDAHIQRIVAGWPYKFDTARATAMGFTADKNFDEIVSQHIADQLGGKWAA